VLTGEVDIRRTKAADT